jgi:FKBP-type peptidyl-prolyl cis-trans isomerase FkpA
VLKRGLAYNLAMLKNKYVTIGGASLVVVVLAATSFWLIRVHRASQLAQNLASLSGNGQVYGQTPQQTADQIAAANAAQAQTNSGSSIGVTATPGANNLGQLNTAQPSSGSTGSPTTGSSAPTEPDPTTFSQYDKYKAGTSALFGDIQVGQGAELKNNQKAAVYYKGWLTNGKLFDASRAGSDGKLQPFIFTLGAHQVITGWEQGMLGMKVGGTRLIIVPAAVGYGATGQGPIPANATLVFEVQLLEVQ